MSQTLIGFSESVDSATLTELAALSDQHITTSGDDVLVPEFAPKVAAVGMIGATITQGQLTAPSLRERSLLDIRPLNVGAEPLGRRAFYETWKKPIELEPGEGLRALAAEGAAGAEQETALVWLMDEITPMPEGEIEVIRATSSVTLSAYAWTLCDLTLTQQLRAGRYSIVGMRAESAGAIAARLVIPGSAFRPGTSAYDAASDEQPAEFRNGGLGSWGEFDHRFIPQVEFLSVSADTSEEVYLDVIKLS